MIGAEVLVRTVANGFVEIPREDLAISNMRTVSVTIEILALTFSNAQICHNYPMRLNNLQIEAVSTVAIKDI